MVTSSRPLRYRTPTDVLAIVVRGPLGVGKSTVARALARRVGARYISIDRILDVRHLWDQGRLAEFLAANRFAAGEARGPLGRGTPVVFDGNFYWRTQIDDLLRRLDRPHAIFTLCAPLAVCIARDGGRGSPHGAEAARAVYRKTTRFDRGQPIDATRPVAAVVEDICRRLSGPSATQRAKGISGKVAPRAHRRRAERG
jgi:predicted kinase